MISIETYNYGESGWWIVVRMWDGVDRPGYTKVFPIHHEESGYNRGRFERMELEVKKDSQKMLVEEIYLEEGINWIVENTTGKWYLDVGWGLGASVKCWNTKVDAIWEFYFKEESDAIAFKLRWM